MLGMAGVLRTGTGNMRFAYLPIDPSTPARPSSPRPSARPT